MKRLLILMVFFISSAALFAQGAFPTAEEGRQFLESTTGVVLEADPFSGFNPAIKEAVEAYWTITPYKFITINEFNTLKNDPEWSFLVLTETVYERDRSGASYSFINLLQGKRVRNLEDMPEFCAIPLSYAGEEYEDADYEYKLGLILQFMQSHARVVMDNVSNPGVRFLRYYNTFVPEVNRKTILAREEDMEESLRDESQIASYYSHPFRLVSEEEIKKAVEEKRPNTLILHKVGPPTDMNGAYVFKMLIGTDDAKMYYQNEHRISNRAANGFLSADLRRLARF